MSSQSGESTAPMDEDDVRMASISPSKKNKGKKRKERSPPPPASHRKSAGSSQRPRAQAALPSRPQTSSRPPPPPTPPPTHPPQPGPSRLSGASTENNPQPPPKKPRIEPRQDKVPEHLSSSAMGMGWQLSAVSVPKDALPTKRAIQLHIRLLWGLYTQSSVPVTADGKVVSAFCEALADTGAVHKSVQAALVHNSAAIDAAGKEATKLRASWQGLSASSTIARSLLKIPTVNIQFVLRTLASSILDKWAPDIAGCDPESTYNLLHEQIALVTWRQVGSANKGYSRIYRVLPKFAGSDSFFLRVYRSFVFSYMQGIAEKEVKEPGSLARNNAMAQIYRRRQDLRVARLDTMMAHVLGRRVCEMAEDNNTNPAHSDDEPENDPAQPTPRFLIRRKVGRVAKVTCLFRMLDSARREEARCKGGNRATMLERVRVDPPAGKEQDSQIPTMPMDVPIDYYEPSFWNSWSLHIT
ncbi:hypothetical protein EV122DRAFT_251976 [Schizophyllum commune]